MEPNCGAGCSSVGDNCFQILLTSIWPAAPAAERLWVGCCLGEDFSTTNSAPRAMRLGCSLSEFPPQPEKAFRPSARLKAEQHPDLYLQLSRSQRFPDGTGPQFSHVASVLYVRSAITKGEEAMAVRGQKMLNAPVSFRRGRTLPLLGGGGTELFFSMLPPSAGTNCSSKHVSDLAFPLKV